jgi:hypothetical protein
VLWRAEGEKLGNAYDGRRTGSSVVWTPKGLLTGVTGEPVVATVGDGRVSVFAAQDGRRLWAADVPVCLGQAFTASGALYAPDTCVEPHSLSRFDLATGRRSEEIFRGFNDRLTVTPLGCRIGRSECGGVRMMQAPNRTAAWLFTHEGVIDSPALASPTASLATGERLREPPGVQSGERLREPPGVQSGERLREPPGVQSAVVIDSPLGETVNTRAIVGRDGRTGRSLWTFSQNAAVRLIATTPQRVLLLSENRILTALDPLTGRVISSESIVLKQDRDPYAIGPVYAEGPYVAIERLKPRADSTGSDDEYYYNARPILLATS